VPYGREALGAALVVLGAIIAAVSYGRWVTNQEALRLDAPLPSSHLPRVVAIGVAVLSALAVGLLIGGRGA
jgi:putative membrane protein